MASSDSDSLLQLTSFTGEDCTPPPPPVNINSLVVHSGATGLRIGQDTRLNVNQFFIPQSDDLDLEIVKSTVEEIVTDIVKANNETANEHYRLAECFWSGATVTDRNVGPQRKWYFLIAALVALSCIACILSATVYSFNNFWMPNEEESWQSSQHQHLTAGKNEELEGLQNGWWYLLVALVSLSCINLVVTVMFSMSRIRNNTEPPPHAVDDMYKYLYPEHLPMAPRIMKREFWLAQPPSGPLDDNILPVDRVVVCHTATEEGLTTPECCLKTRYIQMNHIEGRHFYDIGYNFLVGGDGCVYVGRGWDKVGAHTKGYNVGTIGIAFIGTFTQKLPNNDQLVALRKLLEVGMEIKKISRNYKLTAACQLYHTQSPGSALARHLMTWPHYDSSLPNKL